MRRNLSTRRIFLQRGLTLLAAASTVPAFLDQTVLALADPTDLPRTQRPSGRDGKVLVVVQLSGGNDGLNTVIPFGDDAYHRARPAIAYAGDQTLKLDDYLGLHTNLAPLKQIYDDGRLCLVQGVGYPNPNRSHFRSMDVWHSARPNDDLPTSGWVGRYFDNTCRGCEPHVGVAIGDTLPLAMQGEVVRPLSFEHPDNYRYNGPDAARFRALNKIETTSDDGLPMRPVPRTNANADGQSIQRRGALKQPAAVETQAAQLDFLHRTAMDAQVSSDTILDMTRRHRPAGEYPGGQFGQGLRTVAAMIGGGLSTRVYYVTLGGFDTHANQRGRHEQLLKEFAQGVGAFWKDMREQRNDDRVLMMTFSEFGRRVEQNASGGTDHGAAAPLFLMGPKLRPGVVGDHPSLTDLDQGDLRHGIDFRSVYATVLQKWLETPARAVLGGSFKPLPILR